MKKLKTACLTGYRPSKLPWGYNENQENCKNFKTDLKVRFENTINLGVKTFLTGMAEGFDMIATEILIELRKQYPIKIIAIIPCIGQEKKWSDRGQRRYHSILKNCDDKVILNNRYTPTCMTERNKYMVSHSRLVIACFSGLAGGTKNTIELAKENGSEIIVINPFDYK